MKYYPVCLDIRDKPCLVVGGGQVGTRKVRTLLQCDARVTVVSPAVSPELSQLADQGRIALKQRPYDPADLKDMFLVIGATPDMVLNRQISRQAEAAKQLCNIADVPAACNFILPAVISQGDLQLTVSTSGQSPAFAKHLRRELEARYGPEYAVFLDLMGKIRQRLLAREHQPEAHKPLFESLIQNGLLEMVRQQNREQIDRLLTETVGDDFSLAQLGLDM